MISEEEKMGKGKEFELLIKRILINIGFTEINSDGIIIFDGSAGQMIQGLGEAHNADVLLQPPVQIPFYTQTRIIIECKNYISKVGLNTIRSALGLREDINNFEIVDFNVLAQRRANNRRNIINNNFTHYFYQVAVASMSGFTIQAQEFALTHRISLINFTKMPFWNEFIKLFHIDFRRNVSDMVHNKEIEDFADKIGRRMAVAITDTGQMLFLYNAETEHVDFDDFYSLYWENTTSLWRLRSGKYTYLFELPDKVRNVWLNSSDKTDIKKNAINCKATFLSNMVVYYFKDYKPTIKMISIDTYQLKEALSRLNR